MKLWQPDESMSTLSILSTILLKVHGPQRTKNFNLIVYQVEFTIYTSKNTADGLPKNTYTLRWAQNKVGFTYPQNNVPAAADLAAGGAEVPELVHVGRLGDVVGGGVHPPAASPPRARLAHRLPPARRDLLHAPQRYTLFIPLFIYVKL